MSAIRQDRREENKSKLSSHNVYVVGFVESDTSRCVLSGAQISRVSYRIASGSYFGRKPVVHRTRATTADASTRSLVHLDALRLRTQVHVLVRLAFCRQNQEVGPERQYHIEKDARLPKE